MFARYLLSTLMVVCGRMSADNLLRQVTDYHTTNATFAVQLGQILDYGSENNTVNSSLAE